MESTAGQIAIPRSRFCSDDLPVADRFDTWSDSISLLFRPYLAEGVTAKECAVTTDAFLLGDTVLGTSTMRGVGGYHNPGSSPLRSTAELFIIQFFWRGGFTGYNGAQTLRVNAGDIVIMDTTRGISLAAVLQSDALTLVVPRPQLQEMAGNRLTIYPQVIRGQTVVAQILGHAMLASWEGLPQQSLADAGAVSGLLLGAFAGVLRGAGKETEDPVVDQATLGAICAFIERNLSDPSLGPDLLCKRFHCSRARIYRLFAPLDGVANYIRKLRLERCHSALRHATGKLKVSDIAMEWGFGDISHFNRLFRKTYGLTPGEIRGATADCGVSSSSRCRSSKVWVPDYQAWLEHL